MNKELQAFDNIKDEILEWTEGYEEDLDIIENALNEKTNIEQRLDDIFLKHDIRSFTELDDLLECVKQIKDYTGKLDIDLITLFKALRVIYDSQDIMGGYDDFWSAYRIVEKSIKALLKGVLHESKLH